MTLVRAEIHCRSVFSVSEFQLDGTSDNFSAAALVSGPSLLVPTTCSYRFVEQPLQSLHHEVICCGLFDLKWRQSLVQNFIPERITLPASSETKHTWKTTAPTES